MSSDSDPARPFAATSPRLTILVVEDYDLLREYAVVFFRHLGHHVLEASNAAEALCLLEAEPGIQLLFADIRLSRTPSGFDLAKAVERHWANVKIVLTSGYDDDVKRARVAGISVLPKPYHGKQLRREIENLYGVFRTPCSL